MNKTLYKKYTDRRWTIGFLQNPISEVLTARELDVEWMSHLYKDRWFADPFVLDVDNEYIYLLAEEYYMPIKRAYIAKLTIDRLTKQLIETKPIIKLNTHLSYPAIIRRGKNVYIYPESGQSGRLVLYKYDCTTDSVSEDCVLLKEDVGDATYTDLFGDDIIFCTKPPLYNDETLHVYKKKEGEFIDSEVVVFQEKIARMAGDFFELDGKIYRPAQDCNMSYGHGLVIQEVCYDNGKWRFNEVNRFFSPNHDYPLGIHTLNMYKGVGVVDSVGYWYPRIAKFLVGIKSIIK